MAYQLGQAASMPAAYPISDAVRERAAVFSAQEKIRTGMLRELADQEGELMAALSRYRQNFPPLLGDDSPDTRAMAYTSPSVVEAEADLLHMSSSIEQLRGNIKRVGFEPPPSPFRARGQSFAAPRGRMVMRVRFGPGFGPGGFNPVIPGSGPNPSPASTTVASSGINVNQPAQSVSP